ncbi:hypothetical protein TARUN_4560 [Trichoderma arundinaceum]|uniref:Uncharacterized protein n=1 Tax=Trichoderma arundinaceum TaxID=490622 RepID=A0A395NNU6_TRIAR|nr:hypothetical protein TARUN_4560 [Trichoderma arundinaceum]
MLMVAIESLYDKFEEIDVIGAIGDLGILQPKLKTFTIAKPVKRPSGIPLETGQVFELKANETKYVLDFSLLQLSWDLLRIMAISGAAEPTELWDHGDDGNNGDIASNIWTEDEYELLQRWATEVEEDDDADKAKSLG